MFQQIFDPLRDPFFGDNLAGFVTQIALSESNVDLGNNPVVDSVVMSYSYSGYYGDLSSPIAIAAPIKQVKAQPVAVTFVIISCPPEIEYVCLPSVT